jgi:hypothetical protein
MSALPHSATEASVRSASGDALAARPERAWPDAGEDARLSEAMREAEGATATGRRGDANGETRTRTGTPRLSGAGRNRSNCPEVLQVGGARAVGRCRFELRESHSFLAGSGVRRTSAPDGHGCPYSKRANPKGPLWARSLWARSVDRRSIPEPRAADPLYLLHPQTRQLPRLSNGSLAGVLEARSEQPAGISADRPGGRGREVDPAGRAGSCSCGR